MPKKKKKDKASGEEGIPDSSDTSNETTSNTSGQNNSLISSSSGITPRGIRTDTVIRDPMAMLPKPLPSRFGNPMKAIKDTDPNIKLLGETELAEMEQAMQDHIKDEITGGGMNVFAINKDGISRAVVKFSEKPPAEPLTISFQFPGTFLTHRYVLAIIKNAVASIEGADVTGIRYLDRNVRLGTRGLENRWLVTVNDMRAKQLLMLRGIKVVNRTVVVKSYDDVTNEEYREYQRYAEIQNRMRMGYGAKTKSTLGNNEEGEDGTTPLPPSRVALVEDDEKDEEDSDTGEEDG